MRLPMSPTSTAPMGSRCRLWQPAVEGRAGQVDRADRVDLAAIAGPVDDGDEAEEGPAVLAGLRRAAGTGSSFL